MPNWVYVLLWAIFAGAMVLFFLNVVRCEWIRHLRLRALMGDSSAVEKGYESPFVSVDEYHGISNAYDRRPARPTAGGSVSLAAKMDTPPHDPLILKQLLDGLEQGGPEQVQRWLKPRAEAELGSNEVRRNGFIYYEPPRMTPWVVPSGTTTQFNWTVDPPTTTSTVLTTTTNTT